MTLRTMQPDPTWDPTAHAETVTAFEAIAERVTVHIWGGDWCGDCRRELPKVAAALRAAEIPTDAINQHEVDQDTQGDLVGVYNVTKIPTIVLEIDGETVARFEEHADRPAPEFLAAALDGMKP
jgi:thioredoxin 1